MATLKELQEQAKSQGIKNVKKYKKAELEEMLATTVEETPVAVEETPTTVEETPVAVEAVSTHDFVHLAQIGALDVPELIESLRNMEKGAARKVRQALFKAGHRRLAAMSLN
jgi:hypothetical protein